MENSNENKKSKSWISAIIIGLSIVASCAVLAVGLSRFRSESVHTISATGSASVDFESDLIIWRGSFSSQAYTSKEAYDKIKKDAAVVKKYLLDNGVSEDEIVFNSVSIWKTYRDIYDDNGNYIGREQDGYSLEQSVDVSSADIDKVEKISRDISSLLESGVEFESQNPEYYYSGLDDLKLSLIEQATANSKERGIVVRKAYFLIWLFSASFPEVQHTYRSAVPKSDPYHQNRQKHASASLTLHTDNEVLNLQAVCPMSAFSSKTVRYRKCHLSAYR